MNTDEFKKCTSADIKKLKNSMKMKKGPNTMKDPYMLTPHEVEKDLTWWGYNPHFGWSKFLESALMGIDKNSLRAATFCTGLITLIGVGHRKATEDLETWSTNVLDYNLPRIRHVFKRGRKVLMIIVVFGFQPACWSMLMMSR